jgi:hypothetical protein
MRLLRLGDALGPTGRRQPASGVIGCRLTVRIRHTSTRREAQSWSHTTIVGPAYRASLDATNGASSVVVGNTESGVCGQRRRARGVDRVRSGTGQAESDERRIRCPRHEAGKRATLAGLAPAKLIDLTRFDHDRSRDTHTGHSGRGSPRRRKLFSPHGSGSNRALLITPTIAQGDSWDRRTEP